MARISRRGLLKSGAAAGVLAASGLPVRAQQRGGTLRLGLGGANTSDSWDSRTHSDSFMITAGHGAVYDCLTQVAATGELVGELAERWDASADAITWTFKLRQGVTFHNGKPFGADDVLASLQMHKDDHVKSAAKPIVDNISEMTKINDHEVRITLKAGNADFPFLLSDYHLCIFPAGQIDQSIAQGIGTGMYRVELFDPGVRVLLSRVDSHYKDGDFGWFDNVEIIAINDSQARMDALTTGRVDAVNRVDFKAEPQMQANPTVKIFEVTGNQHVTFPMLAGLDPVSSGTVAKALKHAVNRHDMVDKILFGHGTVGNDTPIGPANQYFAPDIPQNTYDPELSIRLLKDAGLDGMAIDLTVANAAFPAALDAAFLYRASAKSAGFDINVVQEPDEGYWSNTWRKTPWCVCSWSGRATEDWMFSTAYESAAPWNDTGWENARFQELLLTARTELNSEKRRDQYAEMQRLIAVSGNTVIPAFANYVGAHSSKLTNAGTIGNMFELDSGRLIERWWFT